MTLPNDDQEHVPSSSEQEIEDEIPDTPAELVKQRSFNGAVQLKTIQSDGEGEDSMVEVSMGDKNSAAEDEQPEKPKLSPTDVKQIASLFEKESKRQGLEIDEV